MIVLGELPVLLGHLKIAAIIQGITLIIITILTVYTGDRTYQSLLLVPLFLLIKTTTPITSANPVYSHLLVYLPILVSIYVVVKSGKFSLKELGIVTRGLRYYIPLGVIIGLVLGCSGYGILYSGKAPKGLLVNDMLELLLATAIIMGFVEEFIFRSILQIELENWLGSKKGLLISSILFSLTYSNYGALPGIYGALPGIVFGFYTGVTFGTLFLRSRNLPFVAFAHGATNASLLVIAPHIVGYILHGLR